MSIGGPSGSAPENPGAGEVRFPQQPPPTKSAVLWRPAVQELARPDDDHSLVFITQRALATVEDHLVSAPGRTLLGFLIGRVFETPASGAPYVVLHGAVRVPEMVVDGQTEQVVALTLAAAQRVVSPDDGIVVGWYRSDPTGALRISPSDHAAHVRYFQHPWQVALLVTIRPKGTRGGFFRPAGDPASPAPYLPFYELLDELVDPEGYGERQKEPQVSWTNYWSPDPAVWRRARAEAQAFATGSPPSRPPRSESSPPRITPPDQPWGRQRSVAVLGPIEQDEADLRWRRASAARGRWRRWLGVAGAFGLVVAAVALGVRLGLRIEPETAIHDTASPRPTDSAAVRAIQAVRRSIDAYQQRAGLFANRQMTCADLAEGFSAVDAEWLRFTLASRGDRASLDTTLSASERSLATDVDGAEADFERSGCPRP